MLSVPPLNGLRAFEAAARHGGFVAAAAELHVTPAAISRAVKLLEARLGTPLFERHANRLALTEAGAEYRDGLVPLFESLARLTARIAARGAAPVLTIGVGPSFAMRWLIPRLADFARQAPGVEVRLATGGAAAPFSEDWSCGIRLGEGAWPGLAATPLFSPDLVPVCTPALAERLPEAAAWPEALLLRVAHAPRDWALWFAEAGLPTRAPSGPVLGFYGQAIQAALDGIGIAMGIRPYVDDDLAKGRLVAPLPIAVPKGGRWWLLHRPEREREPAFRAFRAWLLDQAAASG
jgi:LysR family glycine cleavage system transcriptional activator